MRSFVEIKSNKRSLTVLVTGRYFVALLEAYGVDSVHTSLRWAEHIDGVGLDWPLGAVCKNGLFELFVYNMHHFTKTGSGQT